MQHARTLHLCGLVQETLNFVSNDPSACCCVLPPLNAPQKMSCCVLQVAKKEQVTTVECAFCTRYHPARHPLVAGTRHSSREGVFANESVLIDLLCLTEMWTIFGLVSFAAYSSSCHDLSCKFELPQLTISYILQKYLCIKL